MANLTTTRTRPQLSKLRLTDLGRDPIETYDHVELYEQPFSRNHNRASMRGRLESMLIEGDEEQALFEAGF
jgi:hypothetical protein